MKALTVRQPWAFAIVQAGKDVENRRQLFTHRGLLAIHAGLTIDPAGFDVIEQIAGKTNTNNSMYAGVIVGVVDVIGAHRWERGCCTSPWAERGPGIVHLELANPRRCRPVSARGKQGIWNVGPVAEAAVLAQLTPTA